MRITNSTISEPVELNAIKEANTPIGLAAEKWTNTGAETHLKHASNSYPLRLTRLLALIEKVRTLPARDVHMWEIMDQPCFEDTETALETALYNAKIGGESHRRNG